jgi:hypothetical protein
MSIQLFIGKSFILTQNEGMNYQKKITFETL